MNLAEFVFSAVRKWGGKKVFSIVYIVFLCMKSEAFDISLYNLGDTKNSKYMF